MLILWMRPRDPAHVDWVSLDGTPKSQLQQVVDLIIVQLVVRVVVAQLDIDNACVLQVGFVLQ